jgi:lysine-specific permease
LHRVLKQRHLSMIAIGGAIGTGLFVASGSAIAQIGPGGAVLTYLLIGIMVYYIMTSLGELAAFMPVAGSFSTYASRYVDRGFGFALGWNFWFSWAVVVAVDLVASQLVMAYWFPNVPGILWSSLFLLLMVGLNAFSARLCRGRVLVRADQGAGRGGLSDHRRADSVRHHQQRPCTRFRELDHGRCAIRRQFRDLCGRGHDRGLFLPGHGAGGRGGGRIRNPRENVPRAIRQVFWRILLFYVLAIIVIGFLIPYTDPQLLRTDVADIAVSPFTLVFQHAGLLSAATVMNAVILTSVLSAGNSGMYAATRMLYNMATEGNAPRIFSRLTQNGVPLVALIGSTLVASLCLISSLYSPQAVYIWLLNLAGMTEFIVWLGIAVSHYRFRRGYVMHGHDVGLLPYKAGAFPFGPIFAFVLCLVVTLGQNYQAFLEDRIDWGSVVSTYLGIPLFLLFWLGYWLVKRKTWISYADMRFDELEDIKQGKVSS